MSRELSRRSFLETFALVGGAGMAGLHAAQQGPVRFPLEVAPWSRVQGYYAPLYGFPPNDVVTPTGGAGSGALPGGLSKDLPKQGPPGQTVLRMTDPAISTLNPEYHSPIQHQDGIITENGLTYVIAHGRVPLVVAGQHYLLVHGDEDLVARPKVFTMDDLMRFPKRSATHFLECSGNTYQAWKQEGDADYADLSVQLSHGLLSGVRWTGVPVREVLESVGIRQKAGQKPWVLAEGADGSKLDRSVPLEKMMDDALLAFQQNGKPLQRENGYPLRLILPGYEGNTNVKWLRRLKVGTSPWMSQEETSAYTDFLSTAPAGHPPRLGQARQFTLVMEVKSVIVSPAAGQAPLEPGPNPITGFAWSGRGRIRRVQVRIAPGADVPPPNGGWMEASLPQDRDILPIALTPFQVDWNWDGQPVFISSRAMDESGAVQPSFSQLKQWRGIQSGYHYNGIQTWHIDGEGKVTNYAQKS